MNLGQVKIGQVKSGQDKLAQIKSVHVYLGQLNSGQVKNRQVKLVKSGQVVKSVQVQMVKFYLGLECGPTQSYLFHQFTPKLPIFQKVLQD